MRKFGSKHFDVISLQELNYETLCKEIVKFHFGISSIDYSSKIKEIILLPDVLISDDEDVICLDNNQQLEVHFY